MIICFDQVTKLAAAYSKSSTPSAPIIWDKKINNGFCKVLIVNSGNANAHTGLKGINAIKTGGYSPGNHVFFINSGTEKYIFLGSLIPTPLHLVDNAIPSYAYSLNDAWTAKKEIIKHGLDQGALLIFGRAREKQSGYITEKYGKLSVDFREL